MLYSHNYARGNLSVHYGELKDRDGASLNEDEEQKSSEENILDSN